MIVHGDCLDVFRSVRGLASIVTDPPAGVLTFGSQAPWIRYMTVRFKVVREATERGSWGLFCSRGETAHWIACALDDAGWEVSNSIAHLNGAGENELWWLCRWGGVTPLQIDRCRVDRASKIQASAGGVGGYGGSSKLYEKGTGQSFRTGGSWPPDTLISHCKCCVEVGTKKVRAANQPGRGGTLGEGVRGVGYGPRIGFGNRVEKGVETMPFYTDPEAYGMEIVRSFECLAACFCGLASLAVSGSAPTPCPGCGDERHWSCPVAMLDQQSGASGPSLRKGNRATYESNRVFAEAGTRKGADKSGAGFVDSGGASRFFPTFRVHGEDTPLRWLVRLITPPGGQVGDPFMGAGSVLLAASEEGHDFLGCDIDAGAVER